MGRAHEGLFKPINAEGYSACTTYTPGGIKIALMCDYRGDMESVASFAP